MAVPFALEWVLDREEAAHDEWMHVEAHRDEYDPAWLRAVRIRARRTARHASLVNDTYLRAGR